ncbi:hypothetical protein EU538_03480 [Candidatus Thorarchaeota archaeon]|nr:MAG: hypothetical protein EU538_03480 [Candidatus Thorarchaeota archaeon]
MVAVPDGIKGIELTEEGEKKIRRIDFVSDSERAAILHDPVRLQILQMLRDGIEDKVIHESFDETTGERIIRERIVERNELSVYELLRLSKEKNEYAPLTKNQVYHHLPKLVEGGYVIKHGVVRTGKRTTDYYRRTAENFVTFGLHYDPAEFESAVREEVRNALPVFDLPLSEDEMKKLIDLLLDTEVMRLRWAGKIEELVQADVTDPKEVEIFDWLLWVYATGQPEYIETLNRTRRLLFPGD